MSIDELQNSIGRDPAPPPGLSPALQALWHDARGDWDQAHLCAQQEENQEGAWVHAYLHRKEGDRGNAGYWYARAGRTIPGADAPLPQEWTEIAVALLNRGTRPSQS